MIDIRSLAIATYKERLGRVHGNFYRQHTQMEIAITESPVGYYHRNKEMPEFIELKTIKLAQTEFMNNGLLEAHYINHESVDMSTLERLIEDIKRGELD